MEYTAYDARGNELHEGDKFRAADGVYTVLCVTEGGNVVDVENHSVWLTDEEFIYKIIDEPVAEKIDCCLYFTMNGETVCVTGFESVNEAEEYVEDLRDKMVFAGVDDSVIIIGEPIEDNQFTILKFIVKGE